MLKYSNKCCIEAKIGRLLLHRSTVVIAVLVPFDWFNFLYIGFLVVTVFFSVSVYKCIVSLPYFLRLVFFFFKDFYFLPFVPLIPFCLKLFVSLLFWR